MPTLLIIEDDHDTCNMLRLLLRSVEADVVIAHEVHNPSELLEDSQPDVVLLDLYLRDSELDGLSVAEFIKGHPETCHIPIVVLSAAGRREEELTYQMGCDAFLRKPVNPNDLLETLRDYLPIPQTQTAY
jgi:CheY-like chemotaxis protein